MGKPRGCRNREKFSLIHHTHVATTTKQTMGRKQDSGATARAQAIDAALQDYRSKRYSSLNAAAKAHGVPESTLRGRKNGCAPKTKSHEEQQVLSKSEEKALVRWILDLSQAGFPPRKLRVREMAEELCKERVIGVNDASIELVSYRPIGIKWIERFVNRHPSIKPVFARRIDAARLKETKREVLEHWFKKIEEVMEEYDLQYGDVYNMDETGFAIGSTQAACVLIDARMRTEF
jgi:hypothetical protein